jgi:hypothetical protein
MSYLNNGETSEIRVLLAQQGPNEASGDVDLGCWHILHSHRVRFADQQHYEANDDQPVLRWPLRTAKPSRAAGASGLLVLDPRRAVFAAVLSLRRGSDNTERQR